MSEAAPVAFLTEAGPSIGLGHARRCLTLALALRERGLASRFLLAGNAPAAELLRSQAFIVEVVSGALDAPAALDQLGRWGTRVAVTDSYQFETAFLAALEAGGSTVLALSDRPDRELPVSLVLNAAVGIEPLAYRGRADTCFLLGPRYALLRSEFAREPEPRPAGPIGRVLITVGGSDAHDLTRRLMRWVADDVAGAAVDVVVGPFFTTATIDAIRREAGRPGARVSIHEQPADMRGLMQQAHLAVCGAGQTTYELAACGTPTMAISTADNQLDSVNGFAAAGTLVHVGRVTDAALEAHTRAALARLLADEPARLALGRTGRALVDGRGTERVADILAARIH